MEGRQPRWQFELGKGTVASYAELDVAAKPTAAIAAPGFAPVRPKLWGQRSVDIGG